MTYLVNKIRPFFLFTPSHAKTHRNHGNVVNYVLFPIHEYL